MLKSTRIWHESFLYSSHPSRLKKKKRKKIGERETKLNLFTSLNVFKQNNMNMILLFGIVLLLQLPQSGNGLHPPQCQWSLYQDIERLNCLVESGNNNNLIVEEEVYGIGPEHAKSLWIECNEGEGGSNDNNNNNFNNPDTFHYENPTTDDDYHHPRSSDSDIRNSNQNIGGYVLSHGVFMAVPNLRDLKLEHCRIAGITPGALSYLPYLQNLTIRAHTSLTWPSSSSLDVKPGVFRGLPDLRHLDLSTTSLLQLPNDFLCFLPSLTYLNLSASYLRDFRSIGITPSDPTNPQNCGNELIVLDLSANHFTLLPPATFAAVPKLEELRIDMNSITIAAERALLGLSRLQIVSLAGNQLTSLPPEFFKDNRQLKEIHLQNNSLAVLAPGLFNKLHELVVLDLSNNELTSEWVNGATFNGLQRLIIMRLDNNQLSRIDSVLFRNLASLQVLNLEHNKINHIAEDGLSGMLNLHTLLLSHNHLTTIDTFVCNGLFVLSFLAIDNNKIDRVEPESFKNCSSVIDLNLSGNKLTSIPTAISVLSLIRTIDLGENRIQDISNASHLWKNLVNLYGLRLTDNNISTVQANSFHNLPSLKIVNLAKNVITSIEKGVFDSNTNLQAIRVDSNRLKDITGLFNKIPNLLWLNCSGNLLEDLQYTDFPPKLQWLDLRSNKIHTLGSCLDVEKLRIRNLDLSQNYLTEIGSSNLPDSIENLILSQNKIHHIQPYTFFRKLNLTRVDLSFNQLSKLDQNAFRLSPERNTNLGVAEILLGSNPLLCDCTMLWLKELLNDYNGQMSSGHYPIIQDGMDVKCTLSFDRVYEPISYLNIASSQFLCKYESHCFSVCNCCDFSACDCASSCPRNCSCYHDQAWGTNLVDCSMLEQQFIPERIPMDVTELLLDGNVLTTIDSHSFIGRKNLKALFLNASHVEVIQNRTFHGLKALQILHLENNFLERLEGYEFEDGLEQLEELYLHQNRISWIGNETFAMLTKLKVLWLHGNNFVDLAIWQTVAAVRLTLNDLTLRGNEWSCDCTFTTQFKDWLMENRAKISDASEVHCVDTQVSGGGGGKLVTNVNTNNNTGSGSTTISSSSTELVVVRLLDQRNHRCSQSTDLSIREPSSGSSSPDMSEYVVLIVSVSSVLILITLVFVSALVWRKTLRVWIHSHCGLRLNGSCINEPPTDRDKLFDAFVSYSSKDEAWVRQILAQDLETNDKYRLCLRFRDLPGLSNSNYIADTIVQASDASRVTLLILSHHFIKGEWSRSDIKSAHISLLKDRTRKVIIILLGQLESKELDQDIRLYLKCHTCLNCDDKRFWQKLRYALPDIKAKNGNIRGGGLHGRTNSSHSYSHTPHSHMRSQPPPIPVPLPPVNSSLVPGRPVETNHHQQHQQLLLQQQQQQQQQAHHHHNSVGGTNNLNSTTISNQTNVANNGSVTRPPQRHPGNRHVAIHI